MSESAERVKVQSLAGVLLDVLEYFEDRMDVVDGSYGIPQPNQAMHYVRQIQDALRAAGVKYE